MATEGFYSKVKVSLKWTTIAAGNTRGKVGEVGKVNTVRTKKKYTKYDMSMNTHHPPLRI
jgi:hypothetical protein